MKRCAKVKEGAAAKADFRVPVQGPISILKFPFM